MHEQCETFKHVVIRGRMPGAMSHFIRKMVALPPALVLGAGLWVFSVHGAATTRKAPAPSKQPIYKSPTCIVFSPQGRLAYVANHTAGTLSVIDVRAMKTVAEIPVGRGPTGVVVSPDGATVFAALTREHAVAFVDAGTRKVTARVKCGFEPTGLAIAPDGKRVYSANYISDDVSVIDTAARKEVARIKVGRAPTYLAVTPDGKRLLVNNSLSHRPATDPKLTSFVSVIDTASGKVVAERRSPGTMLLNMGIAVGPEGKFAFSVHLRPNFNVTPAQVHQGWTQTNALSIIPIAGEGKVVTVLLDNVSSGAANPHGVAVSKDGRRLFVSHRGIHQVSVVDLVKLRKLIARTKPEVLAGAHVNLGFLWHRGDVVRRVPSGGLGPNALAVCPADGSLWVTNYFSDNVAVLDGPGAPGGRIRSRISLGGPKKMTLVRRGEFLFHDATQCFQHWLSCTSCHPRTRADGANWDLLNDGMTNPKNAKSLVGSWQTPPAMALGVRAGMEVAAEKGFQFVQFIQPKPDVVKAVQAYLRAAPYIPSPYHRRPDGSLNAIARRGRKVFQKARCHTCHPGPLYTDLQSYDVGTRGPRDPDKDSEFDTPTLSELYRTAPYLHDGRAATIKEVLTKYNPKDEHGATSKLTEKEIEALAAFLKSL